VEASQARLTERLVKIEQSAAAYPRRCLRNLVGVYFVEMNTQLLDQARQLSLEDQLELVEALWDDIAGRDGIPLPTEAQKAELDRRLAEHEANPDDVARWGEVRAEVLARIGR
jgi:putative addiction module component (TIGR02574 family)